MREKRDKVKEREVKTVANDALFLIIYKLDGWFCIIDSWKVYPLPSYPCCSSPAKEFGIYSRAEHIALS